MVNLGKHNDATDFLKDPYQCAPNVFPCCDRSIIEDYRQGDLCVDFGFLWKPKGRAVVQYGAAVAYSLHGNFHRISRFREVERPIEPLFGINGETNARSYWREDTVFVEDVEVMKGVEGVIPTAIWFQISDKIPKHIRALPEFLFDGNGKLPGFVNYREIDAVYGAPILDGSCTRKVVEGRTKIVDGIANDKAGQMGDGFVNTKDEAFWSAACIVLSFNGPRLLIEPGLENSVKFLYMIMRAVNFSEDAA